MGHRVTVFKPYPLVPGQKIRIEGGPRSGDWEVVEVGDRKMRLRCPVSGKEVEWDRFACFVEERPDAEWPRRDG
ncbi:MULTISPECIES: hypothetical protein [Deferrisoma]